MRRVLYSTTALVAAVGSSAICLSMPAAAQTAGPKAPFSLLLSGDVQTYWGIQSGGTNNGSQAPVTNPKADSHGRALGAVQNAEFRFTFTGRADNGLNYGWYGRFRGESDTINFNGFSVDREDLFLRHARWGEVQLGDNSSGDGGFPFTQPDYGPLENVNSLGPDGGSEQQLFSDPNAITIDGVLSHLGNAGAITGSRAERIYYKSPNLNGFVAIATWGPDGTSRNEEQFTTTTTATPQAISTRSQTKYQNVAVLNLKYQWSAGDWSGIFGGGVTTARGKYVYTPAGRQKAVSDMLGYFGATSVQWRDLRFAVDYTWKGKSQQLENPTLANPTGPVNSNHPTAWGYSLLLERYSYAIYQPDDKGPTGGDWGYGFWYQYARDAGPFTSNGIWELNYFGLGGGYWIAPGLQIFSEAFYFNDYNTHPVGANGGFLGTAANQRNPHGQIYFVGLSVEW